MRSRSFLRAAARMRLAAAEGGAPVKPNGEEEERTVPRDDDDDDDDDDDRAEGKEEEEEDEEVEEDGGPSVGDRGGATIASAATALGGRQGRMRMAAGKWAGPSGVSLVPKVIACVMKK